MLESFGLPGFKTLSVDFRVKLAFSRKKTRNGDCCERRAE